eukprot:Protomagalhaensia_wolfi_Nauph_80__1205@NODE_1710_length_1386_cov_277_024499_g1327_i0_p1_GENE_NODE_1710_length_1386_cov_277_024499_g1327_i0NODE_1710_length_1386_cov_277_024499_g1327_i0_p1_ORF_typecomplete_len316_score54_92tRNA_m1G_MT/PF01746_21/1_9e10_NODE_1710_length_1386_cov_277_024499_g1327_i0561003
MKLFYHHLNGPKIKGKTGMLQFIVETHEAIILPVELHVARDEPELDDSNEGELNDGAVERIPANQQLYLGKVSRKQQAFWEQAKDLPIIIIDAEFSHLHSDKSIISVGKQLAYAYHHVSDPECPTLLIVCGIDDRLYTRLKIMGGFSWKAYLTTVPIGDIVAYGRRKSIEPLFPDGPKWLSDRLAKSNLMYLTADGDAVLEGTPGAAKIVLPFDRITSVCIIGGLIDRNRYKGFCLNKAKALNIPAVKLPIDEILEEFRKDIEFIGTKVMTIDQTCALIHYRLSGSSWEIACEKAVAGRRLKKQEMETADETAHL